MEKTSSDERAFSTPQHISRQSPGPIQVTDGGAVTKKLTAVASVASTTASPTPPQGREILLVPKPPERTQSADSKTQTVSPTQELQFRQRDREERTRTPSDERICLQSWLLGGGGALTCLLIFSVWFFLVPFLVNNNNMQKPEGPAVSTIASPTPEPCLKPVTIQEPERPITTASNQTFNPSGRTPRPSFCLFRNSAVTLSRNYSTTGDNYDYTFEAMPFELCHNVIYWSVAIDNGNINSRMPSFDEDYGLYQLRNINDGLGYLNVKILLALGGYPEDGPHFSMLGCYSITLSRLIANVVDVTRSLR
ncbi:hypothetical protein MRX96_031645 [Rhipicephalus microplus]